MLNRVGAQNVWCGLLESFIHRLPLRVGGERQAEDVSGSGGGVHHVDRRGEFVILEDARPRDDPRDGHVLGDVRAMEEAVPPMIGGEDDGGVFGQGGEETAHRLVRARELRDLSLRHPAIQMAEVVVVGEVDEHEVKAGLDLRDGLIGYVLIAASSEEVGVHRAGGVEVRELFFSDDHHGAEPGSVRERKEGGDGDRPPRGLIVVPRDAMRFGRVAGEHGGVCGERDGREDSLRLPSVRTALREGLDVRRVGLQ